MVLRPLRQAATEARVERSLRPRGAPRLVAALARTSRLQASTRPTSSATPCSRASRHRYAAALRRRIQASQVDVVFPGLSFLETIAVREPTRRLYQNLWGEFLAMADRRSWLPLDGRLMDDHLTVMMDEWYFEGRSVDDGSKLVAAAKHAMPCLRRQGAQRLPRTARALNAWRKATPSQQRVPLPWLAVAAMVCYVSTVRLWPHLGAKWLLAFDTYLRPGEMDALRIDQLIPQAASTTRAPTATGVLVHPRLLNKPGKTGLLDEAVLIDDHTLDPLMEWLTAGRPLTDRVRSSNIHDEVKEFASVARALGLTALRPCRYSLRHAGASHDFLSRRRSGDEIKRRGRWKADSSVRRYGKESLAMAELHNVPREVRI